MRATTFALAFATLLALPVAGFADDISDCNSEKPDIGIKGCTQLIKDGKANNDALAIAYFNRGNAFDDNGDHDGAIIDYTESIKLKPDYMLNYMNRGLSYLSKQDYDNALADFTQAVKVEPDSGKAYYNQGRALEAKGDLANALASYQKASELAPNNKTVQKKIAEIKQQLGQ
ncbi:MAG: tetratricopeptide repeat protein [Alphaproteobacteria bacterium]|nr:tetratricopeptide repeat protein [Alphaproteobacteria bacterium]